MLLYKISEIMKNKMLFLIFLGFDTTVSSMQILETQQSIDNRYCSKSLQCRCVNWFIMLYYGGIKYH